MLDLEPVQFCFIETKSAKIGAVFPHPIHLFKPTPAAILWGAVAYNLLSSPLWEDEEEPFPQAHANPARCCMPSVDTSTTFSHLCRPVKREVPPLGVALAHRLLLMKGKRSCAEPFTN